MTSDDPTVDPSGADPSGIDPSLVDDELGYDDDAAAWEADEVIEVDDLDGDDVLPDLGDLGDDEELDPSALAALGFDIDDLATFDDEDDELLPVVAIVGRPNVGKSTLVNRILGRREAVVEDVPGVTRDRVTYEAEWAGHRFLIVDTGGWEREAQGMAAQVAAQAERAMNDADVVMFVVDATVGATDADEDVVKVLRRTKKPVVLVANKVDDRRGDADAAMLWSLGLGEPYAVSSLHGRGSGDLLDAVVETLPEIGSRDRAASRPASRRAARQAQRRQVEPAQQARRRAARRRRLRRRHDRRPGRRAGRDRRRSRGASSTPPASAAASHEASGHEYYASLRTKAALEKAEVAVVLLEARRAAHRAGRAHPVDGRRERPRAGARVQQVGPASTRSAASTSSARSSATCTRSPGRRA